MGLWGWGCRLEGIGGCWYLGRRVVDDDDVYGIGVGRRLRGELVLGVYSLWLLRRRRLCLGALMIYLLHGV